MGLFDEAIRDHLELKRRHGADIQEIARLERDALGRADRAGAMVPDSERDEPAADAEAQVQMPGVSAEWEAEWGGEGGAMHGDEAAQETTELEISVAAGARRSDSWSGSAERQREPD